MTVKEFLVLVNEYTYPITFPLRMILPKENGKKKKQNEIFCGWRL